MTDALLVVVASAAAAVLVLVAMSLVLAVLRIAATYFVVPVEPPALIRLRKLMELPPPERHAAEAEARHPYPR